MSLSFKFLAIYSCRISGDAGSCSGQFTSLSRLTFSPRGRQPQVSNMFRLSSLARHLSTLPAVWQASRKVHLKNIDFNWFWLTLIDFIYWFMDIFSYSSTSQTVLFVWEADSILLIFQWDHPLMPYNYRLDRIAPYQNLAEEFSPHLVLGSPLLLLSPWNWWMSRFHLRKASEVLKFWMIYVGL